MRLTVHLIPHTHWDREWYLPQAAFRSRLVAVLDDLIARLEADPALPAFLLDGQTVLLEDYLMVRPEQADTVARLVRAGRITTGPWYVLADELVPAGESLIRNLLLGRHDTERWGGHLPVLYSPDAFGHPAALPLLAREFGLRYGVLWRGLGVERTGGRDLFRWEGPAGGSSLWLHLPPAGYEHGTDLLVEADELPAAWARVRAQLVRRAGTPHVALFVGADHRALAPGAGGLAERLARLEPGMDFRLSSLGGFFEAAGGSLPADLASVQGELRSSVGYTWSLQGTLGTRAPLKRRHSTLELLLARHAEPLTALAEPRGAVPVLRRAWRELVQCQFHDTLCGTTSDVVARAAAVRLDEVEAAAHELVRTGMFRLAGHDPDRARDRPDLVRPTLVVWNPAARPRAGVVVAELTFFRGDVPVGPPGDRPTRQGPGARPFALRWPDGRVIPAQILGAARGLERLDAMHHSPDQDEVDKVRVALVTPELPGFGMLPVEPVPLQPVAVEVLVRGAARAIRNPALDVAVEPSGTIRLRTNDGRADYPGLLAFESESDLGDCYTPWGGPRPTIRRARGRVRPLVSAAGPFVAGLTWSITLAAGRGRIGARVEATLAGAEPFLRLRYRLDNRAANQRLRLRLPLGLRGVAAVAGAHFGWERRRPVRVRSRQRELEAPLPTAPAHRYVAAARGRRGLALLAPGFFEYEWSPDGDLMITLLRSVGELSRADLPTRAGHAGWPTSTPDAQCLGPTALDLALAPVTAADVADPARLERLWEDAFVPLYPMWLRDYAPHEPGGGQAGTTVMLAGEGLVFSALKPAERGPGLVLRCWNSHTEPVNGEWRLGVPARTASRARADETILGPVPLEAGGRIVSFRGEARDVVTVVVRF